ncbi:hypothetical protein KsCSTR_43520 [Candidatus Kuenenia stuttgartiensis]|uniref:Uncharacterized protein n=1 Tax=Kuenenia stuttgartiensis TaxID=174633 RepID=Q1PX36_KUEST|nr:hypothetical protein KsCSTR_43520 [Candidatus Kuenenia stuttgartiensis]CAJ71782.1 unknown protein [Candidatus Kuenenia stuttgartiensis]
MLKETKGHIFLPALHIHIFISLLPLKLLQIILFQSLLQWVSTLYITGSQIVIF